MWRTLRPSAGQAQQWVSEWAAVVFQQWPERPKFTVKLRRWSTLILGRPNLITKQCDMGRVYVCGLVGLAMVCARLVRRYSRLAHWYNFCGICYRISFSGRQRGLTIVLFNLWMVITSFHWDKCGNACQSMITDEQLHLWGHRKAFVLTPPQGC